MHAYFSFSFPHPGFCTIDTSKSSDTSYLWGKRTHFVNQLPSCAKSLMIACWWQSVCFFLLPEDKGGAAALGKASFSPKRCKRWWSRHLHPLLLLLPLIHDKSLQKLHTCSWTPPWKTPALPDPKYISSSMGYSLPKKTRGLLSLMNWSCGPLQGRRSNATAWGVQGLQVWQLAWGTDIELGWQQAAFPVNEGWGLNSNPSIWSKSPKLPLNRAEKDGYVWQQKELGSLGLWEKVFRGEVCWLG